jgi:hypothetical protein
MSFKPEVIRGDGEWNGNALRFETEAEALANVRDLYSRWTLVKETRVVSSTDAVNYRWVDGRLVAVVPAAEEN